MDFSTIQALDETIFNAIHPAACTESSFYLFNSFISDYNILLFVLCSLGLYLVGGKRYGYPAVMCMAGFFLAWVLSDQFIKPFFDRPRPYLELGTCTFGSVPSAKSTSFPSGHTITSFTFFFMIYFYAAKERFFVLTAFVIASLVGFSRIYLGMHYLSDVLAGAGFAWVFSSFFFYLTELGLKDYLPAFGFGSAQPMAQPVSTEKQHCPETGQALIQPVKLAEDFAVSAAQRKNAKS